MISVSDCWMKNYCKKSISDNKCLQESDFCIKLFKLDKLYEYSLLSFKQRLHQSLRIDSDGTDRDAFLELKIIEENIIEWVKNGNNLYIYSSICGNGKTSWAVRLIQSYLEKIWIKSDLTCRALFVNVPSFLIALKDNISKTNDYAEYIKDNISNADLVVWDDIAIKTATTYEMENLLSIINTRLMKNLSNIYTSNLIGEDLKNSLGERLYSRIINLSKVIEFQGQDKRGLA